MINYMAIVAAVICGLAIYSVQWWFLAGSTDKIHLPKDSEKKWFFDALNEDHPSLFRVLSSFLATIAIAAHAHELRIWIAFAAAFVIVFPIYLFTCMRSYILVNGDTGRDFEE